MMQSDPSLPRVLRVVHGALTGAVAAGLLQACGSGYVAPPVTPQLAGVSASPVHQLERGFVIHQAQCAKCHPFIDPADYGIEELRREIMPVMAAKSKLDPEDERAVLAYLLAARELP